MERKYAKQRFPVYSDPTNHVASALHQEIRIWKLGRMPGMLLVNKQGIIVYAYYSDNMHDIPAITDTLELARTVHDQWKSES